MSSLELTIPIYQRKEGTNLRWATIGLGVYNEHTSGRSPVKLQRKLVETLRQTVLARQPAELQRFQLSRGMTLHRVHLELTTRGTAGKRRISGQFPLIVEPRWTNADEQILVVYHPYRQHQWFPLEDVAALSEVAPRMFRHDWADLDDSIIDVYRTDGKDLLRSVSFSAQLPTLRGAHEAEKEQNQKRRKREAQPVLERIGADQTTRAIDGSLAIGMPRSPYRGQLQHLLGGKRRRPVIVVGPPGVGKTTILNRWIADQLAADEFEIHRNLDRVQPVWRVSGKRIIAGMSYLGDWEQRCIDLLVEVKKKRAILIVEDLHLFGRLGQSRESDRNFAELFRGPVSRGEMLLIGECTPEQLQRLEDDAPAFASLFVRLHVQPTTPSETLQMMVYEARRLELSHSCAFHPFTLRSILELGGSLFPWTAFPGKALDILHKLAERFGRPGGARTKPVAIEPSRVLEVLSAQTGLPETLLTLRSALRIESVRESFARQIMGQPEAVDAACELVFKIRAGLTDPTRPFAVQLFTGPTGTGKTALATCIATYLFGDTSRLLRFDMSEYGSADGVARLIGDRWSPEGQLTQRIREQPFAVVLLDEVEKAHPAVLNLLLQLFDEGRLTDAAGNTAAFQHTVIIMTSNLGAKPTQPIGFGESTAGMLADIAKAVREFFPPELFNRIDRVVPFHPLTEPVAERIATKELASLLNRRGLRERNIFVYANSAVKRRIVAEAFDPRHGARTVKRYLEDRIASLLAEQVTQGARAALQVIRIYDAEGEYRLHVEPLVERDPELARWRLEELLDLPALRLMDYLPEIARLVHDALEPEELAAMGERIREGAGVIELRYYYDRYVDRLRELRDWLDGQGVSRPRRDPELIEAELFRRDAPPTQAGWRRPGRSPRRFDMREMSPRAERTSKAELLRVMAETFHLTQCGSRLHEVGQHVVWIELLRMGHGEQLPVQHSGVDGLFEWLVRFYASAGALDGYGFRRRDGSISQGEGDSARDYMALWLAHERPVHVLLRLSGVGVYDALAGEQGCHIWRSLAAEPEIVRVRVKQAHGDEAGAGDEAAARLRKHLDDVAAFERALERGDDPLPENPEQLIPTVRTLNFQPPVRDGEVFAIEAEDFLLGYAGEVNVRSLDDLLRRLWYLRWSRQP